VNGLYFVGPVAANSFGPLMRFAFGANYAARRLSRHLAARFAEREQREPRTSNPAGRTGQAPGWVLPVRDHPKS
jgi:hypothetical protein